MILNMSLYYFLLGSILFKILMRTVFVFMVNFNNLLFRTLPFIANLIIIYYLELIYIYILIFDLYNY
jgi:hypothetical protein